MFTCPNNSEHDVFVVLPPGEEIGVLVSKEGRSLGAYSDGTIGVPSLVAQAAEEEDEAVCAICGCDVCWQS